MGRASMGSMGLRLIDGCASYYSLRWSFGRGAREGVI